LSAKRKQMREIAPGNPHKTVPRGADQIDLAALGEPDGYIVVENHPFAYWRPKAVK
jgi:hypothetical protein